MIKKQTRKWPDICLLYLMFRIYTIFMGNILRIVLGPKVVKQYFHLKTCRIVNNYKSTREKTLAVHCRVQL